MTRHTRSKQLIKLSMIQGKDVKFAKWYLSPGYNLSVEYSTKLQRVIDPSFKWLRKGNEENLRDHAYITFTKMTMRPKRKEGVVSSLNPKDYEELPYFQFKLINIHTYR